MVYQKIRIYRPGETIEGDDIHLELTRARVVRGNNVSIGSGCDIDLVEYKNNAANVNPVLWIGGLFGALFVFSMIKLIPKIGVSSTMAGVIAGQLLLAMAIDHFGWFGLAKFGMNFPGDWSGVSPAGGKTD